MRRGKRFQKRLGSSETGIRREGARSSEGEGEIKGGKRGRERAFFAAASASSFWTTPQWNGTQKKEMEMDWDREWRRDQMVKSVDER